MAKKSDYEALEAIACAELEKFDPAITPCEYIMLTALTAKDRELLEGALACLEHVYDCLNPIPM